MGDVYLRSPTTGPLRQGEVLSGVLVARIVLESLGNEALDVDELRHPFAIVLSQDCDLEQDWPVRQARDAGMGVKAERATRLLPCILFAETNEAEHLKSRLPPGSSFWQQVTQNKMERYHYLEAVPRGDDLADVGIPALGIDFKRYFSLPTDEVYKRVVLGATQRRCRLTSPYLEHLSTRFCYYQFRVALPRDHGQPAQAATSAAIRPTVEVGDQVIGGQDLRTKGGFWRRLFG